MVSRVSDHIAQHFRADRPRAGPAVPAKLLHAVSITAERFGQHLAEREWATHASALAGSMLALFRWWLDRGGKESPQAMDELYPRKVWNGLQ
jgi:hypothetical protein